MSPLFSVNIGTQGYPAMKHNTMPEGLGIYSERQAAIHQKESISVTPLQAFVEQRVLQEKKQCFSLRIAPLKKTLIPQIAHLIAILHVGNNLRIFIGSTDLRISLFFNEPEHLINRCCI